MARFDYSSTEGFEERIGTLERNGLKRVVMAGAEACTKEMQALIGAYRHVKTGNMRDNVRPAQYHEDLGSGWVEVYPQGADSRGVSNAKKAFVINYGNGGRKSRKAGDKFITGNRKKMEAGVFSAMQAEAEKAAAELK